MMGSGHCSLSIILHLRRFGDAPFGRKVALAVLLLGGVLGQGPLNAAQRDFTLVELSGRAKDFFYTRNWRRYYWCEDFSFLLQQEKTGKTWRVISREPTPWIGKYRFGPTYTGLKVNWEANPAVKVVGVMGIDRIPPQFYEFKLGKNTITAFIVWVKDAETGRYREWYVNNWFHRWGPKTDKAILRYYADRNAPYDVWCHVGGTIVPLSKQGEEVLATTKGRVRILHLRIRSTKKTPLGYEADILHLCGSAPRGGYTILYGDPKKVPLLDVRRPKGK